MVSEADCPKDITVLIIQRVVTPLNERLYIISFDWANEQAAFVSGAMALSSKLCLMFSL